ncbi:MAG TPA: thioredoxin family protein [Armatimonadota bacterium]|nr:thioredoxin family protein [Armatimonadota bacterium]
MLSSLQRSALIALLLIALIGIGWLSGRNSAPSGSCGCRSLLDEPASPVQQTAKDEMSHDQDVGKDVKTNESETAPAGVPRLVDVGATTCVPCKMMAPILEEIAREYQGKLIVEFVDISKNRSAVQRYRVRAIPTQVLYDENGREFFRHMGFYSKRDILAKFEDRGIELGKGGSE